MSEDREAVIEALLSLNANAKRCPRVTHRLMDDPLTAHDRRHQDIDALLDRLEQLEPAHG